MTTELETLKAAISERQAAREAHSKAQAALGDASAYVTTLDSQHEDAAARIEADMDRRSEALAHALKTGHDPRTIEPVTDDHATGIERHQTLARRAHAGLEAEVSAAADVVRTAETKVRQAVAAVLRAESAELARQFIEADAMATQLRVQLAGLRALDGEFSSLQANGALHGTSIRYPDQRGVTEAAQVWRARAERLATDPQDKR
jgi:hypothetical protein